MDTSEAIRRRSSVRAFRPEPVPEYVLREIVGTSLRAPSWANTQPWELAVVTGEKLEHIKLATMRQQGVRATPDFPGRETFPEPFHSRFVDLANGLAETASNRSGDEHRAWYMQGPLLYGAPAVIYVYVDRSVCYEGTEFIVWPIYDCGLLCENIMLLALEYGLGTIAQAQAVHYPAILREVLRLPENKLMLLGIAIGYPDTDNPINHYRSEREPADKVVGWYGFHQT